VATFFEAFHTIKNNARTFQKDEVVYWDESNAVLEMEPPSKNIDR
jgi:hypothetical protein